MPARVSPTDRIRAKVDDLSGQGRQLPEILEEVARLNARLLIQAALKAEVSRFLGRDRYQRAAACPDSRPGSRSGYRDVTVRTTAGPVTLARLKLRGTADAFVSRLSGSHVTKANALESLVIASFVRGLPVRDRHGQRAVGQPGVMMVAGGEPGHPAGGHVQVSARCSGTSVAVPKWTDAGV